MGRSVITGVGNNNLPQPIVNNVKAAGAEIFRRGCLWR